MRKIVCPRCRQEGNINPAGAMENTKIRFTSYIISCDTHGEFVFVGNLESLTYKATKKETFASLKRSFKLLATMGVVSAVEQATKVSKLVKTKMEEYEK